MNFFSNTNHSEKEIDVLDILGLYEIALFVYWKTAVTSMTFLNSLGIYMLGFPYSFFHMVFSQGVAKFLRWFAVFKSSQCVSQLCQYVIRKGWRDCITFLLVVFSLLYTSPCSTFQQFWIRTDINL